MYLSSTNVRAFPLGKSRSTGSNDITSRIFYEQTVSNIIRQLIDTQGFIISAPSNINLDGTIEEDLEFNLGGYYFKVLNGTSCFPLGNDGAFVNNGDPPVTPDQFKQQQQMYIYFCIDVEEEEPKEIIGQDVTDTSGESVYQGLIIECSNYPPDRFTSHTYSLCVFTGWCNENGQPTNSISGQPSWGIYEDSFIKFDSNSLDITGIDGKH